MNITLGLRALAVLTLVAVSTAVIVKPELIGGAQAADVQTLGAALAISHA